MKIEELYQIYLEYPIICTDTRKICKGCLFFALKGENFDANSFAKEALTEGASYSIIDDEKYNISTKYILVENVLETLQQLANYHRKQFNIPFIGITGSNGKTTTKELLLTVLQQKYKTVATIGNLNNHIGVPLTLLSITKDCEIAIIEMGASHSGEIELLCNIAEPNFGIITNIGTAHIEGFGSKEGVIKTKNELYHYINKTNGTIFLNHHDDLLVNLAKGLKTIEYSNDEISAVNSTPFLSFDLDSFTVQTHLYGEYNIPNIQAAIRIGKYFNIELALIKKALQSYIPSNNRSQIVKLNDITLYLDAYNANPTSMNVAIDSFSKLIAPNKLLILGDMLELGVVSYEEHQKIVDKIHHLNLQALLVGNEFQFVKSNSHFVVVKNTDEAILWLESQTNHFNSILIKGSRGIHLEKISEHLQKKELK